MIFQKNRVIDALLTGMEARILNLGSGQNYIQGAVNVDNNLAYSPDMLADIEEPLPFEDAFFDIVVCSDVLEHLELPGKTMQEIKRVLISGGKLLVSVPNSSNPLYLVGLWRQKTVHDTNEHRHFFGLAKFQWWVQTFGFHIQRFFPSYYSAGFQPLFDVFPVLCFCQVYELVSS